MVYVDKKVNMIANYISQKNASAWNRSGRSWHKFVFSFVFCKYRRKTLLIIPIPSGNCCVNDVSGFVRFF